MRMFLFRHLNGLLHCPSKRSGKGNAIHNNKAAFTVIFSPLDLLKRSSEQTKTTQIAFEIGKFYKLTLSLLSTAVGVTVDWTTSAAMTTIMRLQSSLFFNKLSHFIYCKMVTSDGRDLLVVIVSFFLGLFFLKIFELTRCQF